LSNVLIGIIGVILFIGLALAGALILGDDFKSASNASQAAALMSQLKQAADASDMRKVKLGVSTTPAMTTEFLVPRFLKTPAVNPTPLGRAAPDDIRWKPSFNNNLFGDGFQEPGYAAKYSQAVIGPIDNTRARDICQSIAETYGQTAIPDVRGDGDSRLSSESGCALVPSGGAFDGIPQYVAYVRIAPPGQDYLLLSNYTG
jgi:hypothetical protein